MAEIKVYQYIISHVHVSSIHKVTNQHILITQPQVCLHGWPITTINQSSQTSNYNDPRTQSPEGSPGAWFDRHDLNPIEWVTRRKKSSYKLDQENVGLGNLVGKTQGHVKVNWWNKFSMGDWRGMFELVCVVPNRIRGCAGRVWWIMVHCKKQMLTHQTPEWVPQKKKEIVGFVSLPPPLCHEFGTCSLVGQGDN